MRFPPWVAAAWLRSRSQLRHRWRSWLVLAMFVGIAGGLVLGAAAGARRTSSVYDRLVDRAGAFDVAVAARLADSELTGCNDDGIGMELLISCREESEVALQKVLDSPLVAAGTTFSTMLVPVFTADGRSLQPEEGDGPCFTGTGEVDVDSFGARSTDIVRPVYTSGRAPDPRRPGEAAISKGIADRLGIGLGDEIRIVPVPACSDVREAKWPPPVEVQVVGIQLTPIEVEPESGFFLQSVAVTPPLLAELESYGLGNPGGVLRLRPGVSHQELVAAARADGVALEIPIDGDEFAAAVQDGLRPDTTTLWLLVGLGGAVALVVLGQAMARQVQAESGDLRFLRAIGFTTREFGGVGLLEGAAVGLGAGVIAVLIATIGSLLTPIGRARQIEPDPGFQFDAIAILGGVAILFGLCVLIVTGATVLANRRTAATREARSKPPFLASWTTRPGIPPPVGYGVRVAVEPGRGPTAAPVRSGFLGLTVALATLVGSLTFVAGLDHLLVTPRLVGLNWDTTFIGGLDPGSDERLTLEAIETAIARAARTPGVEAAGTISIFPSFPGPLISEVPDARLMTFSTGPRAIEPTVTDGRAPQGDDEIMLTRPVLDALDASLGDAISVNRYQASERGSRPRRSKKVVEVVGIGVLPIGDGNFGTGAALTFGGLRRLQPDAFPDSAIVDYAPGADLDRVRRELEKLGFEEPLGSRELDLVEFVDLDVQPAESVPRLLVAVMALLALGIVVHLVVTVGRARRHELATLRALGFTPRQVRVATASQATTIVVVSVVVAGAIGTVAGRALWDAYATRLDIVPEPAFAVLGIAILLVAGVVVGNLAAWLVGRRASGAKPAAALRAE